MCCDQNAEFTNFVELQTFGIKIGFGAGRGDGQVRLGEGQGPKAQASSCC